MFIIPRLPKTQEEDYKVYPWASSLCFSAHKRANAQDFTQYLAGTKQRVHHRSPPAGIQVSAKQIRLLAHPHVTDQPFSIRVVYRHLYKHEAARRWCQQDGWASRHWDRPVLNKDCGRTTIRSHTHFLRLTVTDYNLGELCLAVVECFLALYHNLNILISRCKGAKLFLGARYGFHRILTL